METKRIIPCLDMKDGNVVKGVNFVGLKEIGNPVELAKKYCEQGADELVFLDISATNENRATMIDVVKSVADVVTIPFTVGGGIRTLEDMETVLDAGATKISINSAAVVTPNLISDAVKRFGSKKLVVAIDAGKKATGEGWNVYTKGGEYNTQLDLITWSKQVELLGAGEILLTSIDGDGMKTGYDIEMLKAVKDSVSIPVVASGGCGSKEHILALFQANAADAALAASLFHYDECTVAQVKEYLKENNC